MSLNVFDLNIGRKMSGRKVVGGTLTIVADNVVYTITDLSVIEGISLLLIGPTLPGTVLNVNAISNNAITLSLTSSLGASIAEIHTATAIITGY